jgi:hypothetical protein
MMLKETKTKKRLIDLKNYIIYGRGNNVNFSTSRALAGGDISCKPPFLCFEWLEGESWLLPTFSMFVFQLQSGNRLVGFCKLGPFLPLQWCCRLLASLFVFRRLGVVVSARAYKELGSSVAMSWYFLNSTEKRCEVQNEAFEAF